MAYLGEDPEADNGFVACILVVLLLTVVIVCGILLMAKVGQKLSNNKTPLSWYFDVFFDHHMGPGAHGARVLSFLLSEIFDRRRLIYDADVYIKNRSLGVILDAAKLSRHAVVALGNE